MLRWLRLRPTFDIPLNDSRQHAIDKLQAVFERRREDKLNRLFGDYGELYLPPAEHRLWSPYLSFHVEEQGPTARIHGRYAPRMEVWTFVWVGYLAFAFSAFFGLMLGYSQWFVGESMWGLAVTCLGLMGLAILFLVANIGQQWSSDQMVALRQRLDGILETADIQVHRSQPTAFDRDSDALPAINR